MNKRGSLTAILLAILIAVSVPTYAADVAEVEGEGYTVGREPIADNKDCVVEIVTGFHDKEGKAYEMKHCTGFIAAKDESSAYLVTTFDSVNLTANDIKGYCEEKAIPYDENYSTGNTSVVYNGVAYPATVYRKNEETNYCILQSNRMENENTISFDESYEPLEGEEVYLLSYSEFGGAGSVDALTGRIVGKSEEKGIAVSFDQDIRLSGDLVVSNEGYTIGILDLSNKEANGTMYVIPIQQIGVILSNDGLFYSSKQLDLAHAELETLTKDAQNHIADRHYTSASRASLKGVIESVEVVRVNPQAGAVELESAKQALQYSMDALVEGIPTIRIVVLALLPILLILLILAVRLILQVRKLKDELERLTKRYQKNDEDRRRSLENMPLRKQAILCLEDGRCVAVDVTECEYSIGRSKDNSLQLSGAGVSRHHLKIATGEQGEYRLTDISHNGTILNGKVMTPNQSVKLHHGDRIEIPGSVLIYKEK